MSLPKATQCVTIICVYCIEHVVDIPSQDHHVAAASCFGGIKSRSSSSDSSSSLHEQTNKTFKSLLCNNSKSRITSSRTEKNRLQYSIMKIYLIKRFKINYINASFFFFYRRGY